MLQPDYYFDLSQTAHRPLFEGLNHVWEALTRIESYIQLRLHNDLKPNIASYPLPSTSLYQSPDIYIGKHVTIDPGVFFEGSAIIEDHAVIRHGAYIRANTIVGAYATVGHATETKNAVLLEHASAPHFAYVGDSILGQRVNLGAGTKLSNFPVNFMNLKPLPTIQLIYDNQKLDTGLSKFGAILGDDVQIGCNAVTNPGTLIGKRTWVYPLVSLAKGFYPADQIIKLRQSTESVSKRSE